MADPLPGAPLSPTERLKAVEAEVRDLKTRVEVLERLASDRYP